MSYYYLFCNYSFLTDNEEEVRKVTKIHPEDHVIKIHADNFVQAQNKATYLARYWKGQKQCHTKPSLG